MQLATTNPPRHNYSLVQPSEKEDKKEKTIQTERKQGHPYHRFNEIFSGRGMEISVRTDEEQLDERFVLFDRNVRGRDSSLSASVMGAGRLVDIFKLDNIIPASGPIDVSLLGSVIHEVAMQAGWFGADYNIARTLCSHQKNIPNDSQFNRLKFLFPGTIVFHQEHGICIPMVIKEEGAWVIRHRNIFDATIPGVDLWMK